MLDELEARINDMVITSSNLDQRWNDVLDINQVAAVLDEMEGLFDHMEDQLRHSREGGLNKITKGTGANPGLVVTCWERANLLALTCDV